MSIDVYVAERAQLAEGPCWHDGLIWVDIERGEVHHGAAVQQFGERVGAAVPTDDGDLLVATATRLVLASGHALATFPHGGDIRANDGACDSRGRFWIGTMALDERDGDGALYRFDGELVRILDGVGMSNGIGWSPDGSLMYYIDSLTQRVDCFDYDGDVSGRRPFAAIDPADGTPDGLAVDDEGGVWVALYGGSCVRRYDPGGGLAHVLEVPAQNPTSCCFGGEGMRSLFITSAAPDGRIFVTEPGVAGPPPHPFRRTAPSDAEPTSAR